MLLFFCCISLDLLKCICGIKNVFMFALRERESNWRVFERKRRSPPHSLLTHFYLLFCFLLFVVFLQFAKMYLWNKKEVFVFSLTEGEKLESIWEEEEVATSLSSYTEQIQNCFIFLYFYFDFILILFFYLKLNMYFHVYCRKRVMLPTSSLFTYLYIFCLY